jgi:two-component system nitrate/nitrite sensor histidine kinase NarX
MLWPIIAVTLFLVALVFAGLLLRERRLLADEKRRIESTRGLATLAMGLNQRLLGAQDEATVLQASLDALMQFFQVRGGSFLPYDEWGQSMPRLAQGEIPCAADTGWIGRLASPQVRQTCKMCQVHNGGSSCVLLAGTHGPSRVVCVPLRVNQRDVGMFNLYFDAPRQPDEESDRWVAEISGSTERALASLRLRDQEMAALRYIQTSRGRTQDLESLLDDLLPGIRGALDVDYALLWVDELSPFQSSILLSDSGDGDKPMPGREFIEGLWRSVRASRQMLSLENVSPSDQPQDMWSSMLAVPLVWRADQPLGMILLFNRKPGSLKKHQLMLVQTVAGQAALIIQNARLVVQVEYQAVLEERTRLAREIHDGLAQTLAFLKIETSRLQNFLAQGQVERVGEILRGCSQTLADAYLDARQAIDNLRRAPDASLADWLRKAGSDFETVTGLPVEMTVSGLPEAFPPLIQAQLIRIVQEALTNVRKHARASSVHICARQSRDEFILEIGDDGGGFSPADTPSVSQHGLRGMRERAEEIGAEFQIVSRPGQGTTIRVCIPSEVGERA